MKISSAKLFKRVSVLLLCYTLIDSTLHAQVIDSVKSEPWAFDHWRPEGLSVYGYNQDCVLQTDTLKYSLDNGYTYISRVINTYTYNDDKTLYQDRAQVLNNGKSMDDYLYTYYYNTSKQVDTMLTDLWNDNEWQTNSRTIYTYDANSYLVNTLTQDWNSTSKEWINDQRYLYTNNSDGNPVKRLYQVWKNNSWQDYDEDVYTYTDFKKLATDTTLFVEDTTYINYSLEIISYDKSYRLTESVLQEWNKYNSVWENAYRGLHNYNLLGLEDTVIDQDWNNVDNIWYDDTRIVNTYKSCGALPLTLLSFNTTKKNNTVELIWQTTNEVNTSRFNIQRSVDGIHFTTIGETPAKDGSNLNNYVYNDDIENVSAGKIYYRLQMVDRDGKSQLSSIKEIDNPQTFSVSITPNPVTGNNVTVDFYSETSSNTQLGIYNVQGKLLLTHQFNVLAGSSTSQISLKNIPAGIYFISFQNSSFKQTVKFIKEY